ncbi:MAG: hypothetical protein LBT23_05760 [Synergistaceae bacterium]|jgi:hypothetical protein|nr:hypothetical protein [Synergistaceae bacterium]
MSDVSHQLSYYEPSGQSPLAGFIMTLIFGSVVGGITGAVYGFANHHDPLVYINVLIAIFFGFTIGHTVKFGVKKFHIRSAMTASALGLLVFIVAYASHWFFYLASVYSDRVMGMSWDVPQIIKIAYLMAKDPGGEALDFLKKIYEIGAWSLTGRSGKNGIEIKGIILALFWLAEAAAIGYSSISIPCEQAGRPYSERRGEWMDSVKFPGHAAFIEDIEAFKASVAKGDFTALTERIADAPAEGVDVYKYAAAELYKDPGEPFISVENVTVTLKKKKHDTSAKNVVKYLKIPVSASSSISAALGGAEAAQ